MRRTRDEWRANPQYRKSTPSSIRPGLEFWGELGNVGTAAAITSAVFHATGKRVYELPVRLADIPGWSGSGSVKG